MRVSVPIPWYGRLISGWTPGRGGRCTLRFPWRLRCVAASVWATPVFVAPGEDPWLTLGCWENHPNGFWGTKTYLRGAEWMMFGVPIHHFLGFKQHPLEDAGMYFCQNDFTDLSKGKNIYHANSRFLGVVTHIFSPENLRSSTGCWGPTVLSFAKMRWT